MTFEKGNLYCYRQEQRGQLQKEMIPGLDILEKKQDLKLQEWVLSEEH